MLRVLLNNVWSLWLLPAIAVAVVWWLATSPWIRCRINVHRKFAKLPGSNGNFIFGNFFDIVSNRENTFVKMRAYMMSYAHFPLFKIWLLWSARVAIMQAEAVEDMVGTANYAIDKSSFYRNMKPWLGLGLLTSGGEKWRRRRKMLTPSFHFRILDDFVDVFNEQALKLTSKLNARVGSGITFDVFPLISLCALDIICETAMQKSVNAQDNSESDYVRAVNDISEIIFVRGMKPYLDIDWLFSMTSLGRVQKRSLEILHRFTNDIIAERRREKAQTGSSAVDRNGGNVYGQKRRLTFLDTLLECSENGQPMSDESVREEVDTFMFEGHDTTASGIAWAVFLLGLHPEVQRKVQEELDTILGEPMPNRFIGTDDMRQLSYMECVIKEALRLYPPVPFFGRYVERDVTVAGYVLPAGIEVFIDVIGLHRDERYFPDAERFDPDRFLPENSAKRHPFAYVPFAAGPRNCIGQKFAMMEMKVVLGHLLHNFRLRSVHARDDVKMLSELILRPSGGIWIELERRRTKKADN